MYSEEEGCFKDYNEDEEAGEEDEEWNEEWEDEEWDDEWVDECTYLESEDECLEAGCMYSEEEGCFKDYNEDEEAEEEWSDFLYCNEYNENECEEIPFCKWTEFGCEEAGYDWCDDSDDFFEDFDFSFCYELDSNACSIVPFCTWNSGEDSCGVNQWGWGNGYDGFSFGYGNWNWIEAGFSIGDINIDSHKNVIDIIKQVNFITSIEIPTDYEKWSADFNSDQLIDIIDVVTFVNSIINSATSSISRLDASTAYLDIDGNSVKISANGYIGAVQMVINHGSNFNIELTDNALVSKYLTDGNRTTLVVVNPQNDFIFNASGKFEILDVIAANSSSYINVIEPSSFSLESAYPNPFNPTTSFILNVPVDGYVTLKVYNIIGQMVDVISQENMSAGIHSFTWNASNLSSGIYLISAESNIGNSVQKVMLLK